MFRLIVRLSFESEVMISSVCMNQLVPRCNLRLEFQTTSLFIFIDLITFNYNIWKEML